MLDGGLADNIGLRSVIQSIGWTDRAATENPDGTETAGGWSLLTMANDGKLKTIVVITANARVKRDSKADTHVGGPSTFGVLGSASGIPMGNFSSETLRLIQSTLEEHADSFKNVKAFAFEVALEDLPDNADQAESERHFFQNLGTNFELQPFEVDCLIDRGARLLRDAQSAVPLPSQPFVDFVHQYLKGELGAAGGPHPPKCTDSVGKKETGIRSHYIDVGVQYGKSFAQSGDIEDDSGPGLALRITRPSGLSAILDYGTNTFDVTATVPGTSTGLGKVSQRTLLGGVAYTHRLAQLEATAGFALGYGWGSFQVADAARRRLRPAGHFRRRRRGERGAGTGAAREPVAKPVEPLRRRRDRHLSAQQPDCPAAVRRLHARADDRHVDDQSSGRHRLQGVLRGGLVWNSCSVDRSPLAAGTGVMARAWDKPDRSFGCTGAITSSKSRQPA
jgi:hypothetical protein